MTTWTNDTKPVEAPFIWTLTGLIWDSGDVGYLALPWQRSAPSIWTEDTKPS